MKDRQPIKIKQLTLSKPQVSIGSVAIEDQERFARSFERKELFKKLKNIIFSKNTFFLIGMIIATSGIVSGGCILFRDSKSKIGLSLTCVFGSLFILTLIARCYFFTRSPLPEEGLEAGSLPQDNTNNSNIQKSTI